MSNNSKISAHNPTKVSNIAHYGVLMVFVLSLLESITNIAGKPLLPSLPIVLVLILFICALYLLHSRAINITSLKSPLLIGINAFSIFILLSIAYSEYPLLTAYRSLQFALVTNSLYIMLSSINDLKKLFDEVAKITIIFTLLASVYGITIYHFGSFYSSDGIRINGIEWVGIELSQRMSGQRISSFLGNPNPFGVQLMVSALACLYFIRSCGNYWYTLLLVVFLYALLLTGSRASMLGLAGGATFLLSHSYLNKYLSMRTLAVWLIGIGLIITGYLLFNPEALKYISSLMGRKSSSLLSGREVAWIALIEQIKETPFFGIGYRISTEAILENELISLFHSHNLYLSTISEVGIFGFAIFAFIYLWPLINYLFFKENYENNYKIVYASILMAFLINQFFEDMFSPVRFFFIWMFFAVFMTSQMDFPYNKNKSRVG